MSEENTMTFGDLTVGHDDNSNNLTVTLRNLLMSFTGNGKKLFIPEMFKGSEQHAGNLIIVDEAVGDSMQEIMKFMIKTHLKGNAPEPKNLALKDGNKETGKDGEIREEYEDRLSIKFKNKTEFHDAPQVFSKAQELIESFPDPRILKDGAVVDAQLRLYAYTGENNGISAELQALVFIDEGTPFAAGGSGVDKDALFGDRKPQGDEEAESVFGKRKK